VKALLMGGQACILYGAAEFSRDTDFALLASIANLERLREALRALEAEPVFLPPLTLEHLERGHACHFRCRSTGVEGLRIDLLSVMRGCDPFPLLWERREIADLPEAGPIALLALPDLVQAKKTQRDKDWPMIRRLIEADHARKSTTASPADVRFWLAEARTPALLRALATAHPDALAEQALARPFLATLPHSSDAEIIAALDAERARERDTDRAYWEPLRRELEAMRLARRGGSGAPQEPPT
jgi:hypothetical protein